MPVFRGRIKVDAKGRVIRKKSDTSDTNGIHIPKEIDNHLYDYKTMKIYHT